MTIDHLVGAGAGFIVGCFVAWIALRSFATGAKREIAGPHPTVGRLRLIANELERRGVAAVERDREGTPMLFHFVGDENVIGSSSALRKRSEITGAGN